MDMLNSFTAVNTALALVIGCTVFYFFVFGKVKPVKKVEPKTREIKTPATAIIKTPATVDIKTPATVEIKTPATADIKTPATADIKTPATAEFKTPATAEFKTPATANIKTPATANIKTPATAEFKTPATAEFKTPATPEIKTPAADEIKTPTVTAKKTENENKVTKEKSTEASVPKVSTNYESVLAKHDATVAACLLVANKYIKGLTRTKRDSFLDELVGAVDIKNITTVPRSIAKNLTPIKIDSNTLDGTPTTSKVVKPEPPRPFLAAYNATEASNLLQVQHHLNSSLKPSKPSTTAYNNTVSIALEESKDVESLPKVTKPDIAEQKEKITPASNSTANEKSVPSTANEKSVPSTANEKNVPSTANEKNVPSTANEKSVPSTANEKSVPSTANEKNVPSTVNEKSVPSTAKLNDTDALVALDAQEYISSMTQQKTSATQVPSVSVETTNASQLLQCKTYSQKHQQDASDSDIELEIDSQSPSTSVSTGSSTLQSETDKFAAIAAASVAASAAAAAAAAADSNKQQRQQQQQLQHKHQQTNNQIFNTTWDALFDERTMTQTPMSMNNSAIIHVNNGEKKGWTREEKIRKQTQSHMPKMRNRCDYWPACTNKNCKYSHPTAYCRVGDDCSFGDRCSFIHPKDLTEPPKKKNNKSNAGGPKQPLKRTTTGDVLTRPKNNKQSSTLSLK